VTNPTDQFLATLDKAAEAITQHLRSRIGHFDAETRECLDCAEAIGKLRRRLAGAGSKSAPLGRPARAPGRVVGRIGQGSLFPGRERRGLTALRSRGLIETWKGGER